MCARCTMPGSSEYWISGLSRVHLHVGMAFARSRLVELMLDFAVLCQSSSHNRNSRLLRIRRIFFQPNPAFRRPSTSKEAMLTAWMTPRARKLRITPSYSNIMAHSSHLIIYVAERAHQYLREPASHYCEVSQPQGTFILARKTRMALSGRGGPKLVAMPLFPINRRTSTTLPAIRNLSR